jgi:hypothetical protein
MNLRLEPVRIFAFLNALVPLVADGLVVFGLWGPSAEQLAYVNALPLGLGTAIGATIVRSRVTPVLDAPPLFARLRRSASLVGAVPDADPNDNRFTGLLGDPILFFAPAEHVDARATLTTPSGQVRQANSIEFTVDPRWGERHAATFGTWDALGRHVVTFSQGDDSLRHQYIIDVINPPAERFDVVRTPGG